MIDTPISSPNWPYAQLKREHPKAARAFLDAAYEAISDPSNMHKAYRAAFSAEPMAQSDMARYQLEHDYWRKWWSLSGALKSMRPFEDVPQESLGHALYFMGTTDKKYVKVGRSTEPDRRLKQIAGAVPQNMELIFVSPNDGFLEYKMHAWLPSFGLSRVRPKGEWFHGSVTPEQAKTIIDGVKQMVIVSDAVRKAAVMAAMA